MSELNDLKAMVFKQNGTIKLLKLKIKSDEKRIKKQAEFISELGKKRGENETI